ncbi:S41 family peptidase [Lacibacter sp. MH-610]|uniref:S41 family peptidase n=1 Tax=Lacibacter sp. MH-610 TaxID=3020883 RepID=UPI003891C304
MKQILSMLTALLLCTSLTSQDCNCADNLRQLIVKTEENYAGFPAKVNASSKAGYEQLKQQLTGKASSITNAKACFYLLKEYIRFFKDKHFILAYDNEKDYDREIIAYSQSSLQQRIFKKQATAAEGIWINPEGTLKLAIQPAKGGVYKGIVIESKDSTLPKGLVYVTLTPAKNGFIAKEYNTFISTDKPAKQKGNLLQIWNDALFGKIYPTRLTAAEQSEMNTWKGQNNGLDFRQLSTRTAYLKIPTFRNNDSRIQELINQHDSVIKACENLIIDLTGNGGGNTGWVALLPYIITNPIVQYNTYLRVTPENVKHKLADLEPFAVNPIPEEYKKYFPEDVLAAYKKAYRELPTTKEAFYPIPGVNFPVDSVLARPRKVAVLFDDSGGSSTEYFFSLLQQSKKTTTYGIPTIGMMDYEGMSTPIAMPYEKFIVTIPIVKSSWTDIKPIDATGFQPQVLLQHIPFSKWVEFVQKDLERTKK